MRRRLAKYILRDSIFGFAYRIFKDEKNKIYFGYDLEVKLNPFSFDETAVFSANF